MAIIGMGWKVAFGTGSDAIPDNADDARMSSGSVSVH